MYLTDFAILKLHSFICNELYLLQLNKNIFKLLIARLVNITNDLVL